MSSSGERCIFTPPSSPDSITEVFDESDRFTIIGDNEFHCYQNVDRYERQEEEDRYRRDDLEQAGYIVPVEDADRSDDHIPEKRRRGNDGQAAVFGVFERPGERDTVQSGFLGDRYVAEMVTNFNRGQRKLVRESVRFGVSSIPREEALAISKSLQRKGTPFCIAVHPDPFPHYHIVHACPWKWYCCRCYSPGVPKRAIKTDELRTIDQDALQRIIEYLCSGTRRILYIYSGSSYARHVPGVKYVFSKRLPELQRFADPLEISYNPSESSVQPSTSGSSNPNSGQSSGGNSIVPKCVAYGKPEEIEQLIMAHPTVPLTSFVLSNIWLGSKYRFLSNNDKAVAKCIRYIKTKLTHWTIEDFIKYYKSPAVIQPLFSCIKGNFSDYYYSRIESQEIIEDLVQFQMADIYASNNLNDTDGNTSFWTDIYRICNKTNGKINCLELIGPANCGKSYFINWLTEFFINVGHVENFNRYHNFPLQSAYNARVLNWGEAYAESSQVDTVKLLLGGDPCPANIKYENTQTIEKTPVFITANKRLLPRTKPFTERMIRYDWQPCDWLKEKIKKPNPLCFIDILYKYDIIPESVLL